MDGTLMPSKAGQSLLIQTYCPQNNCNPYLQYKPKKEAEERS